jgi:hypothetical protein
LPARRVSKLRRTAPTSLPPASESSGDQRCRQQIVQAIPPFAPLGDNWAPPPRYAQGATPKVSRPYVAAPPARVSCRACPEPSTPRHGSPTGPASPATQESS